MPTPMNSEDFEAIIKAHTNGDQLTTEQVDSLINAVKRLDVLLLVFQNGLELLATNMNESIPELARMVQKRCGRTDSKITKAIAEMAATLVATQDDAIQGYIVNAIMNAAAHLDMSLEDLLGIDPTELTEQEADAAQE